ncbi:RnfH family protein [Serpentinimonas maccroryi]|uniref:RnfH family protein n=1 Tax=Serpentinimonas maccroryi TaxID=1458426 RepID=UPI0020339DF5|nr:RnfH family protein [Serpentinimonas maccroryi]MCM2478217.1 RnfH family protein [Serpentinimonas maccroryi]
MTLDITLVQACAPSQVQEWRLQVPAGTTLGQALQLAFGPAGALRSTTPADTADAWLQAAAAGEVGVWGRVEPASTPLHDGDRIERYRALRVDPKTARRERYRKRAKPQAR